MGAEFSTLDHPNLARWLKDLGRCLFVQPTSSGRSLCRQHEGRGHREATYFWRGDRIEWVLARGFHAWFFNEIKENRVAWPGPALPAPIRGNNSKLAPV